MSRWDFKRNIPKLTDEHVVISFSDNSRERDDMYKAVGHKFHSLFYVVKDDDNDFSIETAKQIKSFVDKFKDKTFVVHCFAGISRSAAVARWIELYLNKKLPPRLQNYAPYNKHIFDTLEALCT